MKRTLIILGIALLAGLLTRIGWRDLTAQPPVKSPAAQPPTLTTADAPAPRPEENTPVPAPDQASGLRIISDQETPVAEGETVITQGYFEPYRNTFVFHTFKPILETQADGQTVLKVKVENINVSLNGQYESHKLPLQTIQPNRRFSMNIGTEGATHHFFLDAKVDPVTSMILMKAKASSSANNLGKARVKK